MAQTKPRLGARVNWSNPLTRGLVRHYALSEGAGLVINDSALGNVAWSAMAVPQWRRGLYGTSLYGVSLQGMSMTGDKRPDITNMSAFTYVALVQWENQDAGFSPYGLITKSNDFESTRRLWLGGSGPHGQFGMYVAGATTIGLTYSGTGDYFKSRPRFIVATYDDSWATRASKIYLDGLPMGVINTYVVGALVSDANAPLRIFGEGITSVYGGPDCDLFSASIYNRALSASEVFELARNPFQVLIRPRRFWPLTAAIIHPLTGYVIASATASGQVRKLAKLSGAPYGSGFVASTLRKASNLSGTSYGSSLVASTLKKASSLSGATVATSSTVSQISKKSRLYSTVSGLATTSGVLRKMSKLSGVTSGLATVYGSITYAKIQALVGSVRGVSSAAGSLIAKLALSGVSRGVALLSGSITLVFRKVQPGKVIAMPVVFASPGEGRDVVAHPRLFGPLDCKERGYGE